VTDDGAAAVPGPGCTPGPGFVVRLLVLHPGESRSYDPAEWRDALVLLENGVVELEVLDGERRCFGAGAVLVLDGLPMRALHNVGAGDALLVAVSRVVR
jgi:hypothetical protein